MRDENNNFVSNRHMETTLRFHTATANDIADLNQLVNSAYRGDSSRKGWTTEADLLDGIRTDENGLRDMIQEPSAIILCCRNEANALLGCVYLKKRNNQLYLGMLTVNPELQGGGIGKQLLKAADAKAAELGCSSITMTVISVRAELIAWYERHGYKRTGETAPFPADPRFGIPKQALEFIVLEKTI
jgi:ribosomal protein S18 acetylase RimI-like enzyme